MLHLAADRRFCVFPFPGLVLAAFAQLLDLTRTTVDLVTNLLSLFVANDCIFALLSADIAAVAVYGFFFAVQQLRCHAHIVDVCASCFDRMDKTTVPVYADNRDARLDIPSATLEGIEYYEDRRLDRAEMVRFATCAYIDEEHHIILKGATGSGKTYIVCALGKRCSIPRII